MHKTTVYLPPDVRLALKQTAARRGCSEAVARPPSGAFTSS